MREKRIIIISPVNNYSSRKEWEAACWQKIIKSDYLLQLLITPHEQSDIVMRAAVIDRLYAGKSYKQIEEELWISPQTISTLKKALGENAYRSYFERGKKERKKRKYGIKRIFMTESNIMTKRTKYGRVRIP